ncbi:hypothetical protein [Ignatzschineria cameli]|uniref:Uncharacterized protein n=1 Tax=Ignatzschineria cameli TaxID=2182793 RepID=A0A2U2ATD5_9GAMM|nr:hypothetical protein [Ignatzschineria cameli]PWD85908.1 hypothetical protein DC080_03865 [Ignatzschineria cameli]PWD87885.1 hypothetical protein DC077_00975 [Ignatzschineria cameli]PWD90453.1 hypothetical protein DC079_04765 [Ignatzschineria cameli]PWD92337.1 hypothetical protein DC081_04475 [Ignatzschineria cameli]PWD93130.1 hypothetical protein DC078_04765 [Ignatzschineria cameli]
MNDRTLFIIALLIALILHASIGYLMLHDEQSRIELYQQEDLIAVTLLPNTPDSSAEEAQDEMIEESEDEVTSTAETEEESQKDEENLENLENNEKNTEIDDSSDEEAIEISAEETKESEEDEPLPYQRNISQDGEYLRDNILPPREEGDYRRIITTEENPYQKLVDDAIALLEDTPFLDKNWDEAEDDSDQPNYYSPQFIDLLKQYNPQNFKENEAAIDDALDEIHDESDDEVSDEIVEIEEITEEIEKTESTPLIVHYLDSPDSEPIPLEEEILVEEENPERAEIKAYRNIYNAAESQIRRLEYNVSLKSTQCYDRYIKGQNRQYRVALIIYENPLRTGVYKSSGNDQLDRCIVEMTNQFIQIPAEMERIRKHAPRRGDAYLLNASF